MAVFTIAGLIIKEAIRRWTLVGALLMGLLVVALSLLPILIHARMEDQVRIGRISEWRVIYQMPIIRSTITLLCLSVIKSLGALFAVLMAGGAVSGEIERGLLSVILPKPVPRWQILLGKWIGLNLILMSSVFVWTMMVWASMSMQPHDAPRTPILMAGVYLMLYPLVVCTLTLALSTIAQRMLGTSLTLVIMAISWFDGIFNLLGETVDVHIVQVIARIIGLLLPQGYIGWWVEHAMEPINVTNPRGGAGFGKSPTILQDWGAAHLHFAHLDAVYVVAYVVIIFLAGAVLFQRRDI